MTMDEDQPKIDTSTIGHETNPAVIVAEGKGKGKAPDIAPHDVSMDEDEDSSDEETGAEDEVPSLWMPIVVQHELTLSSTQQPEARAAVLSNSR